MSIRTRRRTVLEEGEEGRVDEKEMGVRGPMKIFSLVDDTTAEHADHTCMIREAMSAEKSSSMWLGSR